MRSTFFRVPAKDSALAHLLDWAADANRDWSKSELHEKLAAASAELPNDHPAHTSLNALSKDKAGPEVMPYPDERGVVLITRDRAPVPHTENVSAEDEDDGEDLLSKTTRSAPVPLATHLDDVLAATRQTLAHLPLSSWTPAFDSAATLHDWGKADERFQAMLRNGTRTQAWAEGNLIAKSHKLPESAAAYEKARRRAELPSSFRHELLSVQMAECAAAATHLPADEWQRMLALHLIASHHVTRALFLLGCRTILHLR